MTIENENTTGGDTGGAGESGESGDGGAAGNEGTGESGGGDGADDNQNDAGEGAGGGEGAGDGKKKKSDRMVPLSRFLKQHAELQAARDQADEFKRIIEAGGKGNKEDEKLTPEQIEKLAEKKAKLIAATDRFNEKTNQIYTAGVKEFTKEEFDGALDTIRTVGLIPPDVIDTLDNLGDGHKVLKFLGDDLEEVERILSLSEGRRTIELVKLHAKLTAAPKKQISKAPDPIDPLKGGSKAPAIDITDKSLSAADRIKEMRRQDRIAQEKKYGKRS